MAENTNEETVPAADETPIRMRFRVPSRMPSVVGQHLSVMPLPDGVLLSFFEVVPPIIQGNLTDEQAAQLNEMGIIAECVSKVFVPNSVYEGFVEAMNSVLENEFEETEDEK